MKITFNDKDLITLSEIQKKVIQNDIPSEIFESDMHRRIRWCAEHPRDQCYDRNKKSWVESLKDFGISSAPVDKMSLFEAIHEISPVALPQGCDKDCVIKADGQEIFRVTPTHKRMISLVHDMNPDDYCEQKMAWILKHKYERCMERLRNEWTERLAAKGVTEVPSDDDEFAELVFSQDDYKNRSTRENEVKNA